ncbi:hypothetical protein [uncultured Clostridium sp.]|uniref:hypothetical protein n=1 Tax=uncultured Clostridium sp. TaxID=59620 RepID=UPI0025F8FAD4|nr:hypothetical protein [uncultured Clostridium sp.]
MFVFKDNIITFLSNEIMKSSNMVILFKDNKGIGLKGVKKYLEDINKGSKCFYRNLKNSNYYESYYPFFLS